MDHSKTASPHFSHKIKVTESFMKILVAITSMIAHGDGDVRYAHYSVGIYPTDSNHTIGSSARLLRDLEGAPKNSSCTLFSVEENRYTLTEVLLNGVEICLDSLLPPPIEPLAAKRLPLVLILQLDNCSADNKNRYVFAFCSMLVYKGIFREVYIKFLIVGYTHEDIDVLFGRWSSRLKTNNYPILPRLMKSFIDCEEQSVIPHFIEELMDFKAIVHKYLGIGGDFLEGHSRFQQFKFFKDSNGWPLVEYKHLCTNDKWLPEGGHGIRLWLETANGLPKVPTSSFAPLVCEPMKALHDMRKGFNGFVAHWKKMANDDYTRDFKRKNGTLEDYWKGVQVALNASLQVRETLLDGFWPASRIAVDITNQMQRDGTLYEEDVEDALFVGRRHDRPHPSFCVNVDTNEGSFIAVHPADGDPKPFWLARAITSPSPDPVYMHMIIIQYWTPTSNRHINMDAYKGWDTKQGNVWHKDSVIKPTWSSTCCILIAWKPRFQENTKKSKVLIPSSQISIINASVAALTIDEDNNEVDEFIELE